MTDFAAARRHMVDGQVRTADVTDLRIISAMQEIARERFLPPAVKELAYLDLDVPLNEGGRRMLKPMVLARLIQAADLSGTERVLDVGCGTGYSAAVLSRLAAEVVALEEDAALAKAATTHLVDTPNARVISGPLTSGGAASAPYDAILLEGASEVTPESLFHLLKDGGRLVCVMGAGPGAKATIFTRWGDEMGARHIFDATAAVLPGFVKPVEFAF